MSQVEFLPESRDWMTEPRTKQDIERCRRGQHQRITQGWYNLSFVSRCSCGALEYDRSGRWLETEPRQETEQPVTETAGRCFLFHRWSKWEIGVGTYEAGPLGRRLGLPQEWQEEIQVRRCSKCGKTGVRRFNG